LTAPVHRARPLPAALFFILIAFMTTLGLSACGIARYPESPQFRDGSFRNPVTPQTVGWREMPKVLWRFMFDKPAEASPAAPLPVASLTREQLLAAPDQTLVRLGHSTVLMKLQGAFWLTDPVFSERASPVQWAGPKRFHAPPISIDELPPIRGVVLSHDHYDHLDRAAILQLAARVDHFLAPLGVGDLLVEWGVDPAKVRQLDWWQSTTVDGIRFVATPAQHFSGRGLFDGNATLWASWVIEAPSFKLFFSGDGGYFDGFKTIGEKYGPFDVTLLECGAYDSPMVRRPHAARRDPAGPPGLARQAPAAGAQRHLRSGAARLARPAGTHHCAGSCARRAADDAPDRASGRHERAVGDHRLVGAGRLRGDSRCRKPSGIAARSAALAVSKAC